MTSHSLGSGCCLSRFKESLTVYTDDKRELLAAVRKSSQRPAALDLVKKVLPEVLKKKSQRVNRAQAVRQIVQMPIAPKQDMAEQNTIEPVKRENIRHKQNIGHRVSL